MTMNPNKWQTWINCLLTPRREYLSTFILLLLVCHILITHITYVLMTCVYLILITHLNHQVINFVENSSATPWRATKLGLISNQSTLRSGNRWTPYQSGWSSCGECIHRIWKHDLTRQKKQLPSSVIHPLISWETGGLHFVWSASGISAAIGIAVKLAFNPPSKESFKRSSHGKIGPL